MAIHSTIIAWKIPWTEEPGRLKSMGLRRVTHHWVTTNTYTMGSGDFSPLSALCELRLDNYLYVHRTRSGPIKILPYALCLQILVKLNHLVLINFSFMSITICIYVTSFISKLCVCVYIYIYIYIKLSNLYLFKIFKGNQHLFEAIFT